MLIKFNSLADSWVFSMAKLICMEMHAFMQSHRGSLMESVSAMHLMKHAIKTFTEIRSFHYIKD